MYMYLSFGKHVAPIGRIPVWRIREGLPCMDARMKIKYLPRTNMHAASVLQVKRLFLTTASWSANRFTRGYRCVPLMSNSAGSPSTLWRLRPAIYAAVQNYIASETLTQHRCPMSRSQSRNLRENKKIRFVKLSSFNDVVRIDSS